MPSPLGHALAGAAAGWALTGGVPFARAGGERGVWPAGAVFAVCGMLPDLDLLAGAHSGPTHGVGAALIAALAAAALTRAVRFSLAAGAAYASHILLDWLGSDSSPPIGIMALWPFTRAHYESNLHVFDAISRRYWLPGFWQHNVRAIAWELMVLVPPTALIFLWRRRVSRRAAGAEARGGNSAT